MCHSEDKKVYEAVVIGAGIAGISAIKAIKNNGLDNFLLIDSAAGPAFGASAHSYAMCHPYVGRGTSRLQRLTHLAFKQVSEVWGSDWQEQGVFHIPRKAVDLDLKELSQRLVSMGFDDAVAVYSGLSAYEEFQVKVPGVWFSKAGWLDIRQACEREVAQLRDEHCLWNTSIESMSFERGIWKLLAAGGQTQIRTKRVVLANALGVKKLGQGLDLDFPLKAVRGQLSIVRIEDAQYKKELPKVGVSGIAYGLKPEEHEGFLRWVIGSSYDENNEDLMASSASDEENLAHIGTMLNLSDSVMQQLKVERQFVGIRCVANDRMPVIGPIAGKPGLYVVTALGSRAVMWSALASQMLTQHLAYELAQEDFLTERFFAGARLVADGLSDDLVAVFAAGRFFAGCSNSKPILPSGCLAK